MRNALAFSVIAYVLLIGVAMIGYARNIIDVIHLALSHAPLTTEFVLRVAGIIIVPLGSVIGWF